jgi:4-carboxymuconolactone decarboxylase
MADDRLQRGLDTLAQIDPGAYEALRGALEGGAPGLADAIVAFGFGDVASRPGLDLKHRELVSVVAAAALGGAQPQLTAHLVYALKLGWTAEELREALIQTAPILGMPRALNGLAALADAVAAVAPEA